MDTVRVANFAWKRESEALNLLAATRSSGICEGVRLIKAQRVAKCAAAKRSTERPSLMSLAGSYQSILIGEFIETTLFFLIGKLY